MAKRHLAPRKFPQGQPHASFHGTFTALLSGRSSQKQLSSFACVSVNMIYGLHSPKSEHIEWEIWLQSANLFCIEPFKSQRPDVRLRPATQLTSWWQIHPSSLPGYANQRQHEATFSEISKKTHSLSNPCKRLIDTFWISFVEHNHSLPNRFLLQAVKWSFRCQSQNNEPLTTNFSRKKSRKHICLCVKPHFQNNLLL